MTTQLSVAADSRKRTVQSKARRHAQRRSKICTGELLFRDALSAGGAVEYRSLLRATAQNLSGWNCQTAGHNARPEKTAIDLVSSQLDELVLAGVGASALHSRRSRLRV
jgi:hypothetical protein